MTDHPSTVTVGSNRGYPHLNDSGACECECPDCMTVDGLYCICRDCVAGQVCALHSAAATR